MVLCLAMQRAIGVKLLDLITMLKERQESEAVTAIYATGLT